MPGKELQMNGNEIVRELRDPDNCDVLDYIDDAADLIESLQAQLAEAQRRERAARNELCLKCGRYHDAHNGACDGCRWKED
jgi:hypothetical protein